LAASFVTLNTKRNIRLWPKADTGERLVCSELTSKIDRHFAQLRRAADRLAFREIGLSGTISATLDEYECCGGIP
jgi:hypothetical protein